MLAVQPKRLDRECSAEAIDDDHAQIDADTRDRDVVVTGDTAAAAVFCACCETSKFKKPTHPRHIPSQCSLDRE